MISVPTLNCAPLILNKIVEEEIQFLDCSTINLFKVLGLQLMPLEKKKTILEMNKYLIPIVQRLHLISP